MAVRRTGDSVEITFTVPSSNNDGTTPADISRVDVYAYTALSPWDVLDPRRMTLVASVPVRKPPEPESPKQKDKEKQKEKEQEKNAPPRPPEPGEEPGAVVTVVETLTPEMRTPLAPDKKPAARIQPEPPSWFDTPRIPPLVGPLPQPEPQRFYVAYGVSRGGSRGGATSKRPAVSFAAPPPAPDAPELQTTERGVVVTWAIPAGLRLPYQEPAEGKTLSATFKGMESAASPAYLVYLVPEVAPAPGKEAPAPTAAKGPVRLTDKPVTALSWTDEGIRFGVERCYEVRTVSVKDTATVESVPSPAACVTPTDVFPPPAPAGLAAVAGEGAISLIWEGVDAPDLAGYVVLRGAAPDGTLAPLFEAPLVETTYRDTTAKPGVRYVYAVVAIDRAASPNRSALSNRVEETAR